MPHARTRCERRATDGWTKSIVLGETGFDPNGGTNLGTYQVGYANTAAVSVAQIDGNEEVGIER